MADFQSYILCTSPRSGSTLLCKLLQETGVAGVPDSHFHEPSVSDWLDDYGVSDQPFVTERDALSAVFDAAMTRGTGKTGIFGLRLQRRSFEFFMQKLNVLHPGLASDRARIETTFGRTLFVYLTRRDKLDQAISFVKATQTGLWHQAPDGTELERLSVPQEPVYDADEIARQIDLAIRLEAEWQAWFAGEAIDPLRITYDDLSADPYVAVGRILDRLGVDQVVANDRTLPVAKLADATNSAWAARFRAERGRVDV
ncbi:MAG: Stf0 family sulfotransferase [Pseudomonadota bacterium]